MGFERPRFTHGQMAWHSSIPVSLVRDGLEASWRVCLNQLQKRWDDVAPAMLAGWAAVTVIAATWAFRRSRRAKIVVSLLVVGGAIGWLVHLSQRSDVDFYKYVDEVTANPQRWRGRHLLVHGNVVPGSIEKVRGTDRYRFTLETWPPRPYATLRARYSGFVPDRFASCALLVAKGTLGDDGVLEVIPDGLMAKCPSKYDGPRPGGPPIDPCGGRPDVTSVPSHASR